MFDWLKAQERPAPIVTRNFVIPDRFCSLCGINTALLSERDVQEKDGNLYCARCEKDGVSHFHITPRDFYTYRNDYDLNTCSQKAIKSDRSPNFGIAHLHGVYGELDDMYMDFFYDKDEDTPIFRISMVDDDQPFFGTQENNYIKADHVPLLLNINDIHLFDGMTEENRRSYIQIEI